MDVQRFFIVAGIALIIASGCRQASEVVHEDSAVESTSEAAAVIDSSALVGTWYGRAQIDPSLLQNKLATMTDESHRENLKLLVEVFQTTEVGAQFGADGSLQLDIQVQPQGQVMRDSTQGTWQVVEVLENALMIETTEQLPGGGTETNRVRYQFEPGGDTAIIVAPTSEVLADCNPVIVFKRVDSVSVMAEKPADHTVK